MPIPRAGYSIISNLTFFTGKINLNELYKQIYMLDLALLFVYGNKFNYGLKLSKQNLISFDFRKC